MGVTGLWRLIDPSGKAVPLETLEGKVLAIDISIWIYQVLQGYQDKRGHSIPNAHLVGLYHRICKLLYFKIKPVFVFDGGVPLLKKNTIAQRKKQKSILNSKVEKMKSDLLHNLVKRNLVKGDPKIAEESSKSSKLVSDMFKLPLIPADINISVTSDSESDEPSPRINTRWKGNIHNVDIKSEEFKALPPDVRYDILTDLKETRKQNSWGRFHEMPQESHQFSNYQMKRLLKRRHAQESLEAAEREMGGKTLTLEELEKLMSEQGVDTKGRDKIFRIASDDTTRLIYINDPKSVPAKRDDITGENRIKAGCSKDPDDLSMTVISEEDNGEVIGDDINDYDLEEEWDDDTEMIDEIITAPKRFFGKVKLNPAMSYMMENSALSQEQILGLIEQSKETIRQTKAEDRAKKRKLGKSRSLNKAKFQEDFNVWKYVDVKDEVESSDEAPGSDFEVVEGVNTENVAKDTKSSEAIANQTISSEEVANKTISSEELEAISDSAPQTKIEEKTIRSSDSEYDDFVEVDEVPIVDMKPPEKKMEIVIKDTDSIEDDLFADVFETKNENKDVSLNSSSGYTFPDTSLPEEEKLEIIRKVEEEVGDVLEIIKHKDALLREARKVVASSEDIDKAEKKLDKKSTSQQNMIADDKTETQTTDVIDLELKNSSKSMEISQLPENQPQILKDIDSSPKIDDNSLKIVKESEKRPETLMICDKSSAVVETATSNVLPSSEEPKESVAASEFSENSLRQTETSTTNDLISSEEPKQVSEASQLADESSQIKISDLNPPEFDQDSNLSQPSQSSSSTRLTNVINRLESEKADLISKLTNEEDLADLRSQLVMESENLKDNIGKLERQSVEITQQMISDAQELLKLFGIPYIVAPQEAEAQCAYLELINLTDGTVTDDSDIWLFGARCVYKNFFSNDKRVMQYLSKDIEHHFKLTRNQMIQLALLVGSDYTVGISGIGPVTALEILASFPCEGDDILRGLTSFASWLKAGRVVGPGRATLRNKLKNVSVDQGFPSQAIVQAYLFPTVDESRETFTWGKPNLVLLADYTRQKFGWTKGRFEEVMGPVMKRLQGKVQKDIMAYFKVHTVPKSVERNLSKRVQKAVERLAKGSNDEENGGEVGEQGGEVAQNDGKKKRRVTKKKMAADNVESENISEVLNKNKEKKSNREVIPQRERDRAEALQRKLKAIEVLKKSHKGPGKSRGKPVRPARNVIKKQAELSESSSDGN